MEGGVKGATVPEKKRPLIRMRGVHHTYQGSNGRRIYALRGIDLSIDEGEYVALIGGNGCGKSTLLKHLNGLLVPTKGDVWVSHWNTRSFDHLSRIRSTVGIVFQAPDTQIIGTTVEEDVAFGPENLGISEEEIHERVDWALDVTGMTGLRKHPSHLLSAGQKQLLSIASTLSMKPRCLLLDEASSMLDFSSKQRFLRIVQQLHHRGMTIVTATHNMEEATIAQRIIVLSEGKNVLDGIPCSIFAQADLLRSLKLDLPAPARLARRLANLLEGFPPSLLTVDEVVDSILRFFKLSDNRKESILR